MNNTKWTEIFQAFYKLECSGKILSEWKTKTLVFLSGFCNPLTCHAQIAEKVHPLPDALILFGNHPKANATN